MRALDDHEHGNEQYWSEDRENNHEELRRLDDIFHQCYGRVDPAAGMRGRKELGPKNLMSDQRVGIGQLPRLTPQRPGAVSALP